MNNDTWVDNMQATLDKWQAKLNEYKAKADQETAEVRQDNVDLDSRAENFMNNLERQWDEFWNERI